MERKTPSPNEIYTHFKGNQYRIIAIAHHSETMEEMVVYEALYDDHGIFVRPLDMFMSEVDHQKYPDVSAEYRFTLTSVEQEDSLLMQFLDLHGIEEKMNYLQLNRPKLDENFLDAAGESMDCLLPAAGRDEKYAQLMQALKTKYKYEAVRPR